MMDLFAASAAIMMGGSGAANASLFCAICSLPVVAEAEIKINKVSTGYSVRVFRADPHTPGFGTVYSAGYVDSDGNMFEPPENIYGYEWYYGALCMGDNVICIINDRKFTNRILYQLYVTYTTNGGNGKKRFKKCDDSYIYTISNDVAVNKSSTSVSVGFNCSWTEQYNYYECDTVGNVYLVETKTDSGSYTSNPYFSFGFTTNGYLHGYSDDDTLRKKLIAFKQTIDNM